MSEKKNISIFTLDMGPGGAERVISLLLKHLKDDFKVTLVIFYNEIGYDIPQEVNTIILLPNTEKENSFLKKLRDVIAVIFKYHKIIKKEKIEVSMAFLALPNFINGLLAMRHKKLKTIISERCFPSIVYGYNKLSMPTAKILFPLLYNRNDKLFSNSVHINKDLKENFGIKIPMSVIYNPIEFDPSQKLNPENIKSTTPLKVINVGTFEPRKDQKLIVNAFHNLNKGEYHLTFLGDGVLENDLRTQVNNLQLNDHIDFKGKVRNVKDYLIQSDCFVLSSITEGFPNVLLEALSVGLPSIAADCLSGPLELLNDNQPVTIAKGKFYKAKYGILINIEDDIALAKALTYFKEHPEERKRYSELGYERAQHFSLPAIYEQVKDLIIN